VSGSSRVSNLMVLQGLMHIDGRILIVTIGKTLRRGHAQIGRRLLYLYP
jgi:hypothetical protein